MPIIQTFVALVRRLIPCLQRYLSNVQFPYCAPSEVATLNKATAYIFTDMQVYDPYTKPTNKTSQQDQLNDQDDHSRPQTPRYDIGVIETRLSLYETKNVTLKIFSSDSGTPPACAGLLLDNSQALWSSSPVDQPGGRDKDYLIIILDHPPPPTPRW